VDVLIRLEHAQPPAGLVRRLREEERPAPETRDALPFVGWLGLLRALSELVREAGEGTGC
jgi:hypothetical protein